MSTFEINKLSESQNTSPKLSKSPAYLHLTTKVPTLPSTATIEEGIKQLFNPNFNYESVNYIYLVNSKNHLVGVVSIKELFRAPKNAKLKQFSPEKIIAIKPHIDQERAAYLSIKHNIKSIPIVGKKHKFLGVITSDTILNILLEETTEDILYFGGVSPLKNGKNHDKTKNSTTLPLITALKRRIPWLLIGLIGGILASGIIHSFEATLSKNLILAAYIPLVVYIAGAVCTQIQAFIIRDLALNPNLKFGKYFLKEISIVFFTALTISIFALIINQILYNNFQTGLIISISLFSASITALITGLIIPFSFNKLNYDPANATGPISTIIQDISSIIVYFAIANTFLNF